MKQNEEDVLKVAEVGISIVIIKSQRATLNRSLLFRGMFILMRSTAAVCSARDPQDSTC